MIVVFYDMDKIVSVVLHVECNLSFQSVDGIAKF